MAMSFSDSILLRLGTRGSALARAQSHGVAEELMRLVPGVRVEMVLIRTSGDKFQERSLVDEGGKGLFVKELEEALLEKRIDFAVHSYKDVPVTMPVVDQEDLVIAAVPVREDARDVVVMREPKRGATPGGAIVGTSSLRRRCQILEMIPDARIELLRGNIDTRIGKLREGQYDIILLAAAGLKRAGLFDPSFMRFLDAGKFVPAPGQGALAIQCRRGDERTREILSVLNHAATARCVEVERELVLRLKGDCHSPIGALAELSGLPEQPILTLTAAVGSRDGGLPVTRASASGEDSAASEITSKVYASLEIQGAVKRLHGAGWNIKCFAIFVATA
jgi:hydroxymethylbilane synthase